jgi:hypothetical protein
MSSVDDIVDYDIHFRMKRNDRRISTRFIALPHSPHTLDHLDKLSHSAYLIVDQKVSDTDFLDRRICQTHFLSHAQSNINHNHTFFSSHTSISLREVRYDINESIVVLFTLSCTYIHALSNDFIDSLSLSFDSQQPGPWKWKFIFPSHSLLFCSLGRLFLSVPKRTKYIEISVISDSFSYEPSREKSMQVR